MSGERATKLEETSELIQETNSESKKVDINILLNRVRAVQKKERFENTIFFGLVSAVFVITGIIISL